MAIRKAWTEEDLRSLRVGQLRDLLSYQKNNYYFIQATTSLPSCFGGHTLFHGSCKYPESRLLLVPRSQMLPLYLTVHWMLRLVSLNCHYKIPQRVY